MASESLPTAGDSNSNGPPRIQQPMPQALSSNGPPKIQQPTPQTLSNNGPPKIQQPKPQALVNRSGPSAILVSTRQKGNEVLKHINSHPWEYSDIPADYVLGATTCALFLSIKYHKLHPEYIYNRIKGLQGKYNLRIILTMVDVPDHEETLKELSKTSNINNVTVMLCWGFKDAARYLELYKTYEHAGAGAIKGHKSEKYAEKMVDFITVPRGINKTDAAGLVANFGSIRTAINAKPEEVSMVAGWGQTKVKRWCTTVREPFRARNAAKRGIPVGAAATQAAARIGPLLGHETPRPTATGKALSVANSRSKRRAEQDDAMLDDDFDYERALAEAEVEPSSAAPPVTASATNSTSLIGQAKKPAADGLSDGVAAALAKLRGQG